MTESYWPFDGVNTDEVQFSQLFRRLQSSGVWGQPTDTAVKVFADSTGMQVKLNPGYAYVRGFMYYNDAIKTVAIGAAGAGARVDLVVLRLNPTANSITVVVLPGTSGVSIPPNPVQTDAANYDLVLAEVTVPASASTILPGNVVDRRSYMGGQVDRWTQDKRPTDLRTGDLGYNLTSNRFEYKKADGSWSDVLSGLFRGTVEGTLLGDSVGNHTGTLNGIRISLSPLAPANPVDGKELWISW